MEDVTGQTVHPAHLTPTLLQLMPGLGSGAAGPHHYSAVLLCHAALGHSQILSRLSFRNGEW